MTLPRIAISTGDPSGIGPEIALKAAFDATCSESAGRRSSATAERSTSPGRTAPTRAR